MGVYAVDKLMQEARRLAAEYRRATGQPLGISGEIAEYDAARLLGLEIIKDPSLGYDAVGHGAHEGRRIQIKGRVIFDERKQAHRLGQLNLDREWDSVILVLMDEWRSMKHSVRTSRWRWPSRPHQNVTSAAPCRSPNSRSSAA